MSDVKITVGLDGSLKVEGQVELVDHLGNELPTKEGIPFFLCRCGASGNKPFCDGSHKRVGFDGSWET
jgi:CDGSH-type Zn-finger protein